MKSLLTIGTGSHARFVTALFSIAILIVWVFPDLWYTHQNSTGRYFWLDEKQQLDGWSFHEEPLEKAAEAMLVADKTVSGTFTDQKGKLVHVFSAKRFLKKENDSDLFVHTPDRCWTEIGWRIESSGPDVLTLIIHGTPIQFERRIFNGSGSRELVYFCGLMDGEPLPFRLNHNLSVAMKYQLKQTIESSGTLLRATDIHQWQRIWDSFSGRRSLLGPKQFIRISTPLQTRDPSSGDELLQTFLSQWLVLGDFRSEVAAWKKSAEDLKNKSRSN